MTPDPIFPTRIERDPLGEKAVPANAYYGIQTTRAIENFPISGLHAPDSLVTATVLIKKAAALANAELMAMSHYHLDHTANANLFVGSTWIVQQAEYDAMFGDKDFAIRDPSSYDKLEDSKRITLNDADHDVFGDGTVVIKSAPGHTPGHQMLFLRLKKFGPLLLEGDLYHLPEERTLDRVPTFDFDPAMTRATRVKTEAFLRKTGATMWIQHDPPTNAKLRKAPEFYD